MTHLERLVLTLGIIFISLGFGYCCRYLAASGKLHLDDNVLAILRKRLQSVAIFGLMPFSAMLSLWGLSKPEPALLALPLLGVASYIWGGALALLAARLLKLDRQQTGAFYCCGTFTNIAAVGGLVCLVFLGEDTIALVALYRLLEEVYYFGVSFPVARRYSRQADSYMSGTGRLRFGPLIWIIVFALLLGIALNLGGIARPEMAGTIASMAMLFATVLCLFAIGLSLRLSRFFCFTGPGIAMCLIKFIGAPVVITSLAAMAGFANWENGLVLKVVAVLSSMPVAMTALVPPSLFDLDVDLANACWIFSTLGLIFILPVLMYVLPEL